MSYVVINPIRHTFVVGDAFPASLVTDELLSVGALEEVDDGDGDGGEREPPLSEKPLHKQTKAELLITAGSELVEVAEGATNAQIIAAIEAKRIERDGAQA